MKRMCSVSIIFQTDCNFFCVQKKKSNKQKEIFHLVDPRTLWNKGAEIIF